MASSFVLLGLVAALFATASSKIVPLATQNELTPPLVPVEPSQANPDPLTEERRQFLIDMTREAWTSIGKSPRGDLKQVVSSLSTLWLMNLKDEFTQAKELLSYEESIFGAASVAHRLAEEGPGALLSAYALSGDESLLRKAREISARYQTPLLSKENLLLVMQSWIDHKLEYRYLSDLTGNEQFTKQMEEIDTFLDSLSEGSKVHETDSINLMIQLKSYIQSNRSNQSSLLNYYQTIKSLEATGYISTSAKYPQLASIRSGSSMAIQNIWHCLYGSMLTLGANVMPDALVPQTQAKHQLDLADGITETCHLAANSTLSRLPYSSFGIVEKAEGGPGITGYGGYALEPALAESYFVLYRLTGDTKYQTYAWELADAIYKNARIGKNRGFSPIVDSNAAPTKKVTPLVQPADFISGTLKYLYLIFTPETYMSLDDWVFNVAGHPLPICGQNRAYPKSRCA